MNDIHCDEQNFGYDMSLIVMPMKSSRFWISH